MVKISWDNLKKDFMVDNSITESSPNEAFDFLKEKIPNIFSEIYILQCSSGSWDGFSWWIGGVFNNINDAEEMKIKLNMEAQKIKDDCPVKGNTDDMSEEDENKYWSYHARNEKLMEWGDCLVVKYPLNIKL